MCMCKYLYNIYIRNDFVLCRMCTIKNCTEESKNKIYIYSYNISVEYVSLWNTYTNVILLHTIVFFIVCAVYTRFRVRIFFMF